MSADRKRRGPVPVIATTPGEGKVREFWHGYNVVRDALAAGTTFGYIHPTTDERHGWRDRGMLLALGEHHVAAGTRAPSTKPAAAANDAGDEFREFWDF